jgi:flagellar hook-associated protein 3 FlgL
MSTFRLSTAGQHAAAIAEILKQQSALVKTQAQVSSGLRFQTPADDPVAATRILGLQRAQSQLEQFSANAGIANDRLSLGEQSLADMSTLLQRIHELTVQANNGSFDDISLKSIATELKSRAQELIAIANRQDSNGEYLFAGYSTGTRPFADTGSGVTYAGDQGVRQLQISATQKIADGIPGQRLFMDVTEGSNGTFVVNAGTHTGTGVIGVQQVVNATAWVPGNYTVAFTDPDGDGVADTWEVTDNADVAVPPTVLATGSYTDGSAISFNGVQFTVSGQPAVGDTFAVRPAGTESMFKSLDDLISALDRSSATPEARAHLGTDINKALTQLDNSLNHVIDLRTDIGARLGALDTAASLREDLKTELTGSLSSLKDVDYAEAISRLNQQMVGLQAAQAAYTRIGQMSLFDYLR